VGAGGKSWLAEHHAEILDAFLKYLAGLAGQARGDNRGQAVENPAPILWAIYHQMDRWHSLPEPGALLDQPYILMIELDALDTALTIRRQQQEASNPK